MRFLLLAATAAVFFCPAVADAQCFNRHSCGDPSLIEVRSQINLNVPIADHASSSDSIKTIEESRRDLYNLANRECDTLKSIFGGECTLSSINFNTNMQERGARSNTAYVSISTTYQVKKSK